MPILIPVAIEPLWSAHELNGIGRHSNRWQVMAALVARAECQVNRLVETRRGFVLFATIPGVEDGGAIYLYDEPERFISMLGVGDRFYDFTVEELDRVMPDVLELANSLPEKRANTPAAHDTKRAHRRRRRHHHHNSNRAANSDKQLLTAA
jgi:hypothetical protein